MQNYVYTDENEKDIYFNVGKLENGVLYFDEDADASGVLFKSLAAYNKKEGICYIPNYATITAIIDGEEVELELTYEDDLETLKNGIPMENIVSISESYEYKDFIELATGSKEGVEPNEELARGIFEMSGGMVNEPANYFEEIDVCTCEQCGFLFWWEMGDNDEKRLISKCPKCGTVHNP